MRIATKFAPRIAFVCPVGNLTPKSFSSCDLRKWELYFCAARAFLTPPTPWCLGMRPVPPVQWLKVCRESLPVCVLYNNPLRVYVCACRYVCGCMQAGEQVRMCMRVCIRAYAGVYVCVRVSVCVYVRLCVFVWVWGVRAKTNRKPNRKIGAKAQKSAIL